MPLRCTITLACEARQVTRHGHQIKLPSHRDLRHDKTMDRFICEVLGNVDEYENEEVKVVAQINQAFNRDALRSSFEVGMKRQAAARKQAQPV
jgi:hypothetical protein